MIDVRLATIFIGTHVRTMFPERRPIAMNQDGTASILGYAPDGERQE